MQESNPHHGDTTPRYYHYTNPALVGLSPMGSFLTFLIDISGDQPWFNYLGQRFQDQVRGVGFEPTDRSHGVTTRCGSPAPPTPLVTRTCYQTDPSKLHPADRRVTLPSACLRCKFSFAELRADGRNRTSSSWPQTRWFTINRHPLVERLTLQDAPYRPLLRCLFPKYFLLYHIWEICQPLM